MYQVFALKYRPQTFDDIIGQTYITQTLKNGIDKGRISNAYLFAGPRGTGKTTTARILAKAINCVKGPTKEPCNLCDFCQEIKKGSSLDVIEIDGASNRGIDEIRELRERVKYVPSRARYKIYIIDEVHMLTEHAFNALLKTLEEPPKKVVFIFATTAPYKIPLTILSRCQRFNFRKISIKEIISRIQKIAQLEKVDIEEKAIFLIAQKVDGSLRDALSMFDQLIPYAQGKIKEEHIRELLGLPQSDIFLKITDYMLKKETGPTLSLIRETVNQGIDPKEFIVGLINHLYTLFNLKNELPIEIELPEAYKQQASKFKSQHLLKILNFLFDTEKKMRDALSSETYLEQALVRASIYTQVSIDEILAKIEKSDAAPILSEQPQEQIVEKSSEPKIEKIEPQLSPAEKSPSQILWKSLTENISNENPSLASFLIQCNPANLEQEKLLLECKNEFFKSKIEENLKLIEHELSELVHKPCQIIFKIQEKPKSLLEEPIVQKAMEIFNAEPISNR
ncbi:DNA polymerase III subunit gamma/tau [candidate division WOR-3 bacterium]|nr:DNA polymerase III subunit gamma/tau [candidate division WOR-3 bacterium]